MLELKVSVPNEQLFMASFSKLTMCKALSVKEKYDFAGEMLIYKKQIKKYSDVKNSIVKKYDTSEGQGAPTVTASKLSRKDYDAFSKEMDELNGTVFKSSLNHKYKLSNEVVEELTALDLATLEPIIEVPYEEEKDSSESELNSDKT